MQSRQAVDVRGVNIGSDVEQPQNLVFVASCAGCQEDAFQRELNLLRLLARSAGLAIRVRLGPTLELLGALEQRRARAILQRHFRYRDEPSPPRVNYVASLHVEKAIII